MDTQIWTIDNLELCKVRLKEDRVEEPVEDSTKCNKAKCFNLNINLSQKKLI